MGAGLKFILWIVGLAAGGFVALLIFGFILQQDPEVRQKGRDRDAIAECWKQQERKSFDPATQRFIAGACESMEAKFRQRYSAEP